MLQVSHVQSETGRETTPVGMFSIAEALKIFLGFLRRQTFVLIFVPSLVIAIASIYLVTARPWFTAEAELIVDTRDARILLQQQGANAVPIAAAQVNSEVEVLKSDNIAASVIRKLHLTEDPEFTQPATELFKTIASFFSNESPDPNPSHVGLFRRAMTAFKNRLVVNLVRASYVIQIDFRSYSAERAAQIANEIADAYIADQLDVKYNATRRASAWLQDRIKELRVQLSNAAQAVVQYKAQHNIVSTGDARPLLNQQQVTELSNQVTIARTQTAEAQARLDRINSVLKKKSPDISLSDESFGATVADTLRNPVVTKLRGQYLDLAARESDWSRKYGPNHLAVINLRNQMREIRGSIFAELKRLGETYKSDYEIAKQREQEVRNELALAVSTAKATDASSITLGDLQSTAQAYKALYDNFLQHYMEAVQQESFPISNTRVITAASVPLVQSSPNALLVLPMACLVGIIFGFGVGILREFSDRVFRSVEQIETLLHTTCIAFVPRVDRRRATNASDPTRTLILPSDTNTLKDSVKNPSSLDNDTDTVPVAETPPENLPKAPSRKKIASDGRMLRTVVDAPLSRFSESIRSIKLALDLRGEIKANRVVGFTSSLPNEGKSTIAFSLAQLAASVGARTLLIDCDLRNPSLSRALAPRAKAGLIEVITNKVSLENAIWKDASTNVAFLPAVVKFRFTNSTEILSSAPMKKLFEALYESYDYIVVDLPPLAPVVDVRATIPLINSFVFVIEWGRTRIEVVEHALGQAQEVYDKLLGVVLNKVDMRRLSRYATYHQSYYYNKHNERYGYTE
jgi:succinoglycan biosynthesis transport protein ExoP